jgi:signal transduction histidine kinase
MFLHLSIKNKLILIIVIATTIIIGTGFTFTIVYDINTYKSDMVGNTRINAQLIGEYCVAPLTFRDQKEAKNIIEKIKTIPFITTACVYDEQGSLFASYQKVPDNDFPSSFNKGAKDEFEKDNFKIFSPVIYHGIHYGTIYLKTSNDLLNKKINRHIFVMVLLMIGLIVLSYFIALKLQSAISKPILTLTQTTNKITREADYSLRVKKVGYDEIGLLYDSFNEMLTQLNIREKERDIAENLLRENEERIRNINQELEERVVQRTAQLVAANKELEAFAYSIAHDLRSPLRGLDGFSQILLEEYNHNLDKQGKNYLHRLRSAAQLLGKLIDDLLNLSRITRDEMKIRQIHLSEMVLEITDNFKATNPDRQVKFQIQEGIKVKGDGRLLRIALENLIGNAWKFTSKHLKAVIEFGVLKQDEKTVYFVRDDGAGFDMQYAQKLFGAFQRLHDAREFPGTGIGLVTVQRIIQRHGGAVWAEGEVEKGATFYFTIP